MTCVYQLGKMRGAYRGCSDVAYCSDGPSRLLLARIQVVKQAPVVGEAASDVEE